MRLSSLAMIVVVSGCEPVVYPLTQNPPPFVLTPGPDRAWVGARLDSSGVQRCPRPAERDTIGPYEAWVAEGTPDSRAWISGGLLAGDIDDDGFLDVVAPLEDRARLYRGRHNAMARGDERLASFDLTQGTGGSMADVDGDGDLDLLVLRYDQPAALLHNDGNGHFVDASADLPVPLAGPTTSTAWGDLDLDGDLDLFVGSYGYVGDDGTDPGRSYLFENLGDGRFLDRSDRLPDILHQGHTRVGGLHDLDGDGYPELYVVNDIGAVSPNVLLRNHYGELVLDDTSGLALQMDGGGGLGVGDIDGDDVPDLLIPQWDTISLMLSGGGGRWIDAAAARGLEPGVDQRVGWGAELADLDNDGDLDGVVAYGTVEAVFPEWENPERQPDALFLQQDDGTFVDVADEWGVDDPGVNRGVVIADFDGDGWLDLAKRDLDGPSTMYVSRCGRNHWLRVRLRDGGVGNRNAIGARVRVFAEDGTAWSRWVTAGGTGYGTGGPPEVHFGLGERTNIARIEVRWPDGAESSVAPGLEADQMVLITRDSSGGPTPE